MLKKLKKTTESAKFKRIKNQSQKAGKYTRFAISMPVDDYTKMEAFRKSQKISRSEMVLLTLRHWFRELDQKQADAEYVRGYELIPEDSVLIKVMEQVQSETLDKETW